jgi:hypothetical protein
LSSLIGLYLLIKLVIKAEQDLPGTEGEGERGWRRGEGEK